MFLGVLLLFSLYEYLWFGSSLGSSLTHNSSWRGRGRRTSIGLSTVDVKNCLLHALARTYAHFFISILYVNFQFGSNEYILIVWHSSSLAAKLLRRVTRAKPDVYSRSDS